MFLDPKVIFLALFLLLLLLRCVRVLCVPLFSHIYIIVNPFFLQVASKVIMQTEIRAAIFLRN